MKEYLFIGLFFLLFILNEFYIKNKITSFFKKFTQFSNTLVLLITVCTALYTYKNNPTILVDLINPYIKQNFKIKIPDNLKTANNKNIEKKNDIHNKNDTDESINISIKKNTNSTNNKHKRNVSETKKKYVASSQHWKCENCKNELDASFEVHHVTPLYLGGDNDVKNLVALCRNCHGKETVKDKVNDEN